MHAYIYSINQTTTHPHTYREKASTQRAPRYKDHLGWKGPVLTEYPPPTDTSLQRLLTDENKLRIAEALL